MTEKERLIKGNEAYVASGKYGGDVSPAKREAGQDGQRPYAVVLTCSDSRVIPEAIFSAGIGELFVIRVAGNVVSDAVLGSIEYALGHLGANAVLVLGHTRCGAIDATLFHAPAQGFVTAITAAIEKAVGTEKDPLGACEKNVAFGVKTLRAAFPDATVLGGVYDVLSGSVAFLD